MRGQKGIILIIGAALAACTNGQLETTAGSVTMGMHYETVDLPLLLDPTGVAAKNYGSGWAELDDAKKNDLARAAYHAWEKQNSDAAVASRNQIQDRLIGASNQLCHNYELYMQDLSSQGNFWSGLLTTAAATAGTLFSGGTSQIFAGVAAVSSGGRAEFNQDFFYKEAVPAIFKGIRAKRSEVLTQIASKRAQDSVSGSTAPTRNRASTLDYTLEAAIGDVIDYHWQCSLASGIAHLGSLATLSEEVGKAAAASSLAGSSNDGQMNSAVSSVLGASKQAQAAITASAAQFGTSFKTMTKLAAGEDGAMKEVNARRDATVTKVTACSGKVMDAATAVTTARQAFGAAKGAEITKQQYAFDAELDKARLLSAKLDLSAARFAEEMDALSRKMKELDTAAANPLDAATVVKEVKEALKAPVADVGC